MQEHFLVFVNIKMPGLIIQIVIILQIQHHIASYVISQLSNLNLRLKQLLDHAGYVRVGLQVLGRIQLMRATTIETLEQAETPAAQTLKRGLGARVAVRIVRVVLARVHRAVLVLAVAFTLLLTRRRGALGAATRDARLLSRVASGEQVELVQALGRALLRQLDQTQLERRQIKLAQARLTKSAAAYERDRLIQAMTAYGTRKKLERFVFHAALARRSAPRGAAARACCRTIRVVMAVC